MTSDHRHGPTRHTAGSNHSRSDGNRRRVLELESRDSQDRAVPLNTLYLCRRGSVSGPETVGATPGCLAGLRGKGVDQQSSAPTLTWRRSSCAGACLWQASFSVLRWPSPRPAGGASSGATSYEIALCRNVGALEETLTNSRRLQVIPAQEPPVRWYCSTCAQAGLRRRAFAEGSARSGN